MERRLATIQKVSTLSPIEGADKIEVARVLGWDCVVKKGEFKEGDLGVYIEVDSVLPDKPVFEFMKERKFRVKTVKLRGQISQGLFLSVASFPEIKKPKEDMDVTKLLGIVKYDPPEVDYNPSKSSKAKKRPWWFYILIRIPFLRKWLVKPVGGGIAFPSHLVPKTDETRIQAFGDEFLEANKDLKVNVTQKMDGTSVTIIWHKNKLSVASRNVWFPTYKANVYWDFVKQVGFDTFLKKGVSLAIQGELCGPGIQGNKYKLSEVILFIFGAYDIAKQEYMTPHQLKELTSYIRLFSKTELVRPVETLLDDKPISAVGTTVDEWMQFATTRSSYNPETWNEGIVIRSMDNKPYGVKGMNGRRWSFKAVSSEFLLQYGL
jgi:hypothetical protein